MDVGLELGLFFCFIFGVLGPHKQPMLFVLSQKQSSDLEAGYLQRAAFSDPVMVTCGEPPITRLGAGASL